MCEVTDTCAEIELNNLVLKNNAHPCAMTPFCAILSKTKRRYGVFRTKNDVGMNHLFPDILPVFCSTFSWLLSLGRVLFLSRLFGLVWVDAYLVLSGYRLPISMMRAKHNRYLNNKRKLRDKK